MKARRKILRAILNQWLGGNTSATTVRKLISALNGPGWFDVKMRVKNLLVENCPEEDD